MPNKFTSLLAIALSIYSMSSGANEALEKYIRDGGAADPGKYVILPFGKMIAVEEADKITYMSENGRFVLTGRMVDIWEKKEITDIEQLRNAYETINLRKMGLEPEKLNTLTIGKGEKEVSFFVDPNCGPCHQLMNEAIKLNEKDQQYRFNFIVIPALGDHSNLLSKGLFCSTDTDDKKLDALLKNTIPMLAQPETCDTRRYDLTLVGAQAIGVNGVPFLINHDGTPFRGKPDNLKNWLEGEK